MISLFKGNYFKNNLKTFAMCYSGFQFGNFAGRLGDGRVLNLGKIHTHNLQLKGSGETLYARSAVYRFID